MNTYFIPGPTSVQRDVQLEVLRPAISHRSKEYADLHKDAIDKLKDLFNWHDHHVFLSTSSATGLMEGVIRNCVNKTVLHTICGAFSKRWAQISELNNKTVKKLEVEWGKAIKPKAVKKALIKHKPEAITITYCETSTGVLNPLKKLCKTIRETLPETLILVDATSAFGGAPLKMKEWDIDVMLFSVQKAFALPPGLAIAVVSKRAFEKSKQVKNKGYYFNFEQFAKYNAKNNTPATPAIPVIYALRKQLERMKKEGIKTRYARHKKMLDLVDQWRTTNNFNFFSEKGYQSPTVSTLEIPKNTNVQEFIENLKQRQFTVPAGYGPLKQSTFRIGHMGEHTPENIQNLLNIMTEVLTY